LIRRTLVAAACGCLTMLGLAAPALAEPVVPKKATNYAAGDLKGTFDTGQAMLASLGVRSGGKKVDILIRVAGGNNAPCSYVTVGGVSPSIRKDGTFSATVPLRKTADGVQAGTATIKGEFVDLGNAGVVIDATARAKVPITGGKTCDTGNVALVGVDPSKGINGQTAKKAFFVGLLDAKSSIVPVKLPILMKLSSDGKTLDTAVTTVAAKCTSGSDYTYGLLAVTKDAFTGNALNAQDSSLQTSSDGTERTITVTMLKGTFGARKFTGTFQVTRTVQDAAGTATKDSCDSGAVKATMTRTK
jgi:hypothetical protein